MEAKCCYKDALDFIQKCLAIQERVLLKNHSNAV